MDDILQTVLYIENKGAIPHVVFAPWGILSSSSHDGSDSDLYTYHAGFRKLSIDPWHEKYADPKTEPKSRKYMVRLIEERSHISSHDIQN